MAIANVTGIPIQSFPTTEQPNFFRTHPTTLDRMRDEIKHKRPQQIYSEQLQNNDSFLETTNKLGT